MPLAPVRSLLLALTASLVLAATAGAVPPPFGGLTPFPGAAGCINATGAAGCGTYAPQADGQDVVVSGSTLYASAAAALIAYRRGADGSLTALNCVASVGPAPCGPANPRIAGATAMAVSAVTHTLYVATGSGSTSRVVAFRLGADGAIGAELGCIAQQAAAPCIAVRALDTPRDLALSADGRRLYTASAAGAGGIALFTLTTAGAFDATPQTLPGCVRPAGGTAPACADNDLTVASALALRGSRLYVAWRGTGQNQSGVESYVIGAADGAIGAQADCIATNGLPEPACPGAITGLTYPDQLALAPDGRSLAVGGGGQAVTTLAIDAGGNFGPRLSCESGIALAGCTTRTGLAAILGLALSPDGKSLYAAAGTSGVWAFDHDPLTGATSGTAQCIAAALAGCTSYAGLGTVATVAAAPEGPRMYAGSQTTSGLAVFQREVGPSCLPTSGTSPPAAPLVSLTLSCSDANGDPLTYSLAAAPDHGTATVSAAGAATYLPAPGFSGTDSFTFTATDGSVAALPTNVVIGVVPPPAPPVIPPVVVATARSTVDAIGSPVRRAKLTRFTGRATGTLLRRVEIAVVRLDHGAHAAAARRAARACRRLRPSGRLGPAKRTAKPCVAASFLSASGTARWTFTLIRPLPRGRYVIVSRATGAAGTEKAASSALRNRRLFVVR